MKATDIKSLLGLYYRARRTLIIEGAPGLGKTSVVFQTYEAMPGGSVVILPAPLMESVDVHGIPEIVERNGERVTRFAITDLIPWSATLPTCVLIDEIAQAPMATKNALASLIYERRIANKYLPDCVGVVCTGNRAQDRSGTSGYPKHLEGRVSWITMDFDIREFTAWCFNNGVDPSIIAFGNFRADLIDGKQLPGEHAYCCPRTLVMVSDIEKEGLSQLPHAVQHETISGTIGTGAATEYIAFKQVMRSLPNVDGIFLNPSSAPIPTDKPAAMYAVCSAIARKVTDANAANALAYLSRMSPEFSILGVKMLINKCPSVQSTHPFTKWASDHQELFN